LRLVISPISPSLACVGAIKGLASDDAFWRSHVNIPSHLDNPMNAEAHF
jgi:hypothetical protein